MGDIFIRYVKLPASVKAFTMTDGNDDYNVYVNSELNSIEQKKAIDHEIRHINGDHFYRETTVYTDENDAEENNDRFDGDDEPVVPYITRFTQLKEPPIQLNRVPRTDFKNLRSAKGLTRYQTAKLAGIRPSLYTEYELGFRLCTKDDEEKILEVLQKE